MVPACWTADNHLSCPGCSSEGAPPASSPASLPGYALFPQDRNTGIPHREARIARPRPARKPWRFRHGAVARHSARCVLLWLPHHEGLASPSPRVKVRTLRLIVTSHSPVPFRSRGTHDVPASPMIDPSPNIEIACPEMAVPTADTPPYPLRSCCSRIDHAVRCQCIRASAISPIPQGGTAACP